MRVKVPGKTLMDLNIALRQFKKLVKETGILLEYKSRQEYIKPSAKRRRMLQQAKRRLKYEENDTKITEIDIT